MILEEATFKKFGHYPSALKSQSNKPILAACDDCGKIRETSKNHYHSLCGSCAGKGRIFTDEHKANIGAAGKGKTLTEETKALMSAAKKGKKRKPFTEEHNAKISAAMKGRKCKPFTEEHKAKMRGENHHNWQGGISFEPYCVKFNDAFKEYIRAKFGHKCFLCPKIQAENERALDVHHVNYNKDCGCDGDETCNFVPLCISCHAKTNTNRAYWQKLITNKLHCLIIGWGV